MFPSPFPVPPAQFGIPVPPTPSSAPPPPLFGYAALPATVDARPENEELLRQVGARFDAFVDHALHVLNQSRMTVRWYRDAMRNYVRFLQLGLGLPMEDFQRRIYDIDGWGALEHPRSAALGRLGAQLLAGRKTVLERRREARRCATSLV